MDYHHHLPSLFWAMMDISQRDIKTDYSRYSGTKFDCATFMGNCMETIVYEMD